MRNSLSCRNLEPLPQSQNKSSFYKEHKNKQDSRNFDFHPSESILKPLEISLLTNLSGLQSPLQSKTKGPSLKLPIFTPKKIKDTKESEFYKNMSQKLLSKVKSTGHKETSKILGNHKLEPKSPKKIQSSQPLQEQLDDTVDKSPRNGELPDIKTQRNVSNSPLRSRVKLVKKSCTDFMQLKSEIIKGMDKSQEKIKLEELKKQSPKVLKFQQVYDELKDLRKSHLTIQTNQNYQPDTFQPSSSPQRRPGGLSGREENDLYCMSPIVSQSTRNRVQKNSYSQNIASVSNERLEASTGRNQGSIEESIYTDRNQAPDPFDKLIIYKNKKMPFSLALMAKMRHQIFQEVKQPIGKRERDKTDRILQLKEKIIPEEKARFLERLDEVEKNKKYQEMQSKKAYTNTIYQLIAMDKSSKKRLKLKMKEQFPVNSRFLNAV